eukprot:3502619-Pleurochrysis_carterae.AAC.1
MSSSILARGRQSPSKSFTCMTVASSLRGSGTWPVECRRKDGGPDVEAVGCVMVGGGVADDD